MESLKSAETLLPISANDAASRAYYAAFYAVSAVFALAGKTFKKHSAVRAAVHRDLVHPGLWSVDLARYFDGLWELRNTADYGVTERISASDATAAVESARRILRAVEELHPELTVSEEDA
jgi:uncharacterized protein